MATMADLIQEYWTLKGNQAQLNINGLIVDVQVLDLRQVWNRLDALISPVKGSGQLWVEARRLIRPV